ncbi:MAG TPA: hypothetical protein VFI47_30480 [Acidimicrobiales bacterium]|nr:hypothetical protein [Acidimicrobiales bacterium]
MRPLSIIAGGLALAVADFRTESLDLLPDPVGWGLVAVGCWRLSLTAAPWLALLTAGLSLSDAALPYRYARLDPLTGDEIGPAERPGADVPVQLRFDAVSGWRLAAMTLATVAAATTLWCLLRELEHRARAQGEIHAGDRVRAGRWLVIGAWALPLLVAGAWAVAADSGRLDPVWNGSAEYLALAGVAAFTYVLVVLVRHAGAAWAVPERPWWPSPWDEIRLRRAAGD